MFIPFNTGQIVILVDVGEETNYIPGPWACVGKRLALMEIRRVTAELLIRYDTSLATSKANEVFLEDGKDMFTLSPAPLFLNFTKRV